MGKTFFNLYPRVCDPDNIWRAYKQAARGKRMHASVAAFEYDLEQQLWSLEKELGAQTYTPGAYHNFVIGAPKRRLISAAPFRDRVVHHALMNVIEPLFERQFIFDSYANRVGKGTHRALDRCAHLALVRQRARQISNRPAPSVAIRTVGTGQTIANGRFSILHCKGS